VLPLDCGDDDGHSNALESCPGDAGAKSIWPSEPHQLRKPLAMGKEAKARLVWIVKKLQLVRICFITQENTDCQPRMAQASRTSSPFLLKTVRTSFTLS
jgi:hypothetical protein